MKPPMLVDAQTTGSLGDTVTSIKMGFDEDSIEHLLMLLTDLYSDKPLAVVREYSTNARDAQLEAGVTRPIEVSLPNAMSPFFKVRDYGVGMDAQTIANVYSKYGASSKRGSNDFNGMLGIGGKSALTYTTQFTVTSVKNGRKIVVLVSRVGQVAQMQIVSDLPTTDEPGTEVSVPVKSGDTSVFQAKAEYLFKFWDEGSVLVNSKPPARVEVKQVTPRIGTTTGLGGDVIVMGGVPYPVQRRLFDNRSHWGNTFDIVAFVDIGDVAITPSREALMHDTPATDDTIAILRMEFATAIRKSIQDDVNAASTKEEGYKRFKSWQSQFGAAMPSGINYNGTDFPDRFMFPYGRWLSNSYRYAFQNGYNQIDIDGMVSGMVITGFDADSITPRNKERIRAWKVANGVTTVTHLLIKDAALPKDAAEWMPKNRIVSWTDIKAVVLPKATPTGPRKQPSVDIFPADGGYARPGQPDATKTILYVSPKDKTNSHDASVLYAAFPKAQLVELGANRWDKFKRDNAGAVSVHGFLRKKLEEARDALTADDLMYHSMSNWDRERLSRVPADKIDDPTVVAAIKIVNGEYKSATLDRYNAVVIAAGRFGIHDKGFESSNPLDGYPLTDFHREGSMEFNHSITYINAVYNAANPKKEN